MTKEEIKRLRTWDGKHANNGMCLIDIEKDTFKYDPNCFMCSIAMKLTLRQGYFDNKEIMSN